MKPRHVIRDMIIFLTSSCYKSDNAGNSGNFLPARQKKEGLCMPPSHLNYYLATKNSYYCYKEKYE